MFILVLFVLFVNFFALPSFKRFLARETIFTESEAPFDDSTTPAVSIRATNYNAWGYSLDFMHYTYLLDFYLRMGYKIAPPYVNEDDIKGDDRLYFTHFCNASMEFQEIEKCFTKNIYHPSDLILNMINIVNYEPVDIRFLIYNLTS